MPRPFLLLFTLLLCAHSASAVTFLVTTNADSGPGSLRQAILDANATPGPDDISFSIGSGPQTIQPLLPLPDITDAVSIDGATQPGYTNAPVIELDGSAVVGNSAGLTLACSGTEVSGLIINRFPGAGIRIFGHGQNFIAGNYVGTDRSGAVARPNQSGIVITNSTANQIGLIGRAWRNIVSGNSTYGIVFSHSRSNVVEGNYIGTDAKGTFALPNALDGIFFENFGDFNTIGGQSPGTGNLISGNGGNGIRSFISFSNVIQGNYIGTDNLGTSAIPNGLCGINGGFDYTIGGATLPARNIISGNAVHGIEISGYNVIQGNLIGTDGSGTTALGNGVAGILVVGEGALIGGVEPQVGNVISGNGDFGIRLVNSSSNIVQGNLIGTDHTGQFGVPNRGPGVLLASSARNNFIGGTIPGEANIIAFNTGDGVLVQSSAVANIILANSIHSNGRLGINLQSGGEGNGVVTPNDVGDSDIGPNNLQNYPVLTNVVYLASSTIIQGYLRSSTNGSFSIDLYANVATEQSGYGEGQFYVGNVDVDTDENGFTEFAFVTGNNFSNQFFTATALNYDTDDTSEFSAAIGGIRITSVRRISNLYRVSFTTRKDRSYLVQYTGSLSPPISWSTIPVPAPTRGTGGELTVTDPATSMGMRLYRVLEQP